MIDFFVHVVLSLLIAASGPWLLKTLYALTPPWLKKILAVVCVLLSIWLLSMALEPNPATSGIIWWEGIANTAIDVFLYIWTFFLFFAGVALWFDKPTEEMPSSAEHQSQPTFEIKR